MSFPKMPLPTIRTSTEEKNLAHLMQNVHITTPNTTSRGQIRSTTPINEPSSPWSDSDSLFDPTTAFLSPLSPITPTTTPEENLAHQMQAINLFTPTITPRDSDRSTTPTNPPNSPCSDITQEFHQLTESLKYPFPAPPTTPQVEYRSTTPTDVPNPAWFDTTREYNPMAEFLERPISPNKISGRARVPAAGRRDECVAKLLAEKRELHRKKQRRMKMALEVVRGGEGRGKDEGRAFVM